MPAGRSSSFDDGLVVTTANVDFNKGGNKAYVQYLCERSDVVMFQEAKDFKVKDCVPSGWQAYQDVSSDAKAGSAVAVNSSMVSVSGSNLVKLCDPPPGGGMLTRYGMVVQASGISLMACHNAPQRYDSQWNQFINNTQNVIKNNADIVIGMDANMAIATMAKKLGNGIHAYGTDIDGLFTKRQVTNVVTDTYGKKNGYSDHPSISGTVD